MKEGQKQLLNIVKSELAKTNDSNAHSCALILLFITRDCGIGSKTEDNGEMEVAIRG